MKYKAEPEEFFALTFSLINDLQDSTVVKYKKKLINSYINTTIKLIQSKTAALSHKFVMTVCMHSMVRHIEQESDMEMLPKEIREKIEREVVEYLCMQEISRIRAIIIDLYTGLYTDDVNYSVRPENWAVKVVAELKTLTPLADTEMFKESKKLVLCRLQGLLAKELKEAFLSKSKPFGRKGNQLVINILYIQQYFKEHTSTEGMQELVKEIQGNFKDAGSVAKLEELKRFIK
ncbi:uncharacterized protein NEMAJ01_0167 [Nematocida major]|uniref:uncharacterized protein n=1 Tax=Nematocida major TaxID=1912982 RepID=UPI0020075ED0|nr:uncharacterized protein NEMAJ01_0167 [Nematocida major]KAH9385271.1 hypothetical protein NEMAJ01_0167 [Nematocida major]